MHRGIGSDMQIDRGWMDRWTGGQMDRQIDRLGRQEGRQVERKEGRSEEGRKEK